MKAVLAVLFTLPWWSPWLAIVAYPQIPREDVFANVFMTWAIVSPGIMLVIAACAYVYGRDSK